MSKQDKQVEALVASITKVKVTILQLHQGLELLRLPGVNVEIRADCLRSLRGSAAYMDVLVDQVYASDTPSAENGWGRAGRAPITEEIEAVLPQANQMRARSRKTSEGLARMPLPPQGRVGGSDDSVFGGGDAGPADEEIHEMVDYPPSEAHRHESR